MKNKFQLIILLLAVCTLTGCEKDNIDTYSGKDNIYFTWAENGTYIGNGSGKEKLDSLGVSFAFDTPDVTQKIFKLPVSVQGIVSDKDRPIKLVVKETSTAVEGVHFDLPDQIVFHANLAVDTIPITLYRTADMKDSSFTIELKLESNAYFSTKMIDKENLDQETILHYTQFKLSVNDVLKQPSAWFAYYLGDFTAKKLFLMVDLLDINPADFNERGVISIGEMHFYGSFMQRYLNEQKAAGKTVYEEDGTEMVMGLGVQ